jgi:hypothetical protein
MKKIANVHRFSATLALAFVLTTATASQAGTDARIITYSGETIASIFDRLKPSSFADYREFRSKQHNDSQFLREGFVGEQPEERYVPVQCTQCPPDTVCAGHYEKLVNSSGCVDPYGACALPLNNAVTDTVNATYSQGSYDSYCGVNCCLDAQPCTHP